jgi:ABC-type sugar transport system permease subunit
MNKRAALLMLIPAAGFYILSFAAPMVLVGRLSFLRYNYVESVYVGFDNFVSAVKDPYFLKSFVNSWIFVLFAVPLSLTVSYKIASFLSGFNEKVQSIGRFVLFLPGLASGLVMAMLWKWLLKRDGSINHVLSLVNIAAVPWLSEAWAARVSISMIIVITGIGGYVIMFAAYMHSVPKELKDAAVMDGASERQYKKYIVFPIMVPTILLSVLLAIVGIMQLWETVYVLTGEGGPEGSTATPVYEIFLTAFQYGKQGLASAKGLILILVIATILAIKQRAEKLIQ